MAPAVPMGMGYGGYGYGGGMMGGGNGMGLYLGLSLFESFQREQQRQVYLQQQLQTQRQLGQDQAAIQALQNELNQQNAKVDSLRAQGADKAPPPQSVQPQTAPGESAAMAEMRAMMMAQQKELEALKAAAK